MRKPLEMWHLAIGIAITFLGFAISFGRDNERRDIRIDQNTTDIRDMKGEIRANQAETNANFKEVIKGQADINANLRDKQDRRK